MNLKIIDNNKTRTINCPTAWSEMKAKELVLIVPFLFDRIRELPMRVGAMSALTGIALHKISPTVARDIVSKSAFLQEPCDIFIINKIYPTLLRPFYLPAAGFKNITALEYATFQHQLGIFLNPTNSSYQKQTALNTMVAHLCRPEPVRTNEAHPIDDKREAYDQHKCDGRIAMIKNKVAEPLKLAILWQFLQAERHLKETFSSAMKTRKGKKVETSAPQLTGQSTIDMIYDMAEKHIFGDFTATANTRIYTLYNYMMVQSKKRKQQSVKL